MLRTKIEPTDNYEGLARSLIDLDPDGFQRFGATFGPSLRAWFIRRGLRASDAEDLASDCITDFALKVPNHYRPGQPGGFQRWVFVLARHALVDWLRQHSGDAIALPETVLEAVGEQVIAADLEALAALDEALLRLSDIERAVVQLRDLGIQHDYDEIGLQLGIPAGTARVHHHRALRRLRKLLQVDPRMQPFLTKNRSQGESHV